MLRKDVYAYCCVLKLGAIGLSDERYAESAVRFGTVAGGEKMLEEKEMKCVAGAKLYQLAPENLSLMESYVLKTANGKLIVIDGGIDGCGKDREPYLPAALRAIAGVGEGEYFEVEAWFLSHAHSDHYGELVKMLCAYTEASNFKVKNFYFDIPPFGTSEYPSKGDESDRLEDLKRGFTRYAEVNGIAVKSGSTAYDELNGAVINHEAIERGLEFSVDGIRIDVLQTWDISDGDFVNCNSLVLRVWAGDRSVLFLNDLGAPAGERLLKKYGAALKSDLVQTAHHGQNGVQREVYDAIDGQIFLWTTPLWVWNNTTDYTIGDTRRWVNGGEDFTTADRRHLVACLYSAYPSDPTRVADWESVLPEMCIELP